MGLIGRGFARPISSEDVEATNGLTGSTALQGWEDEGGATQ